MGLVNIEELRGFISEDVEVRIYDSTWSDQSAFRSEKVEKVEVCPNNTHLRIYFSDYHFFAIPLTSRVMKTASMWSAFDENSRLHYVIKTA